MKNQSFLRRLHNAWNGIRASFLSEKSFRLHVTATFAILIILTVIQPEPLWWALLLLTCGLVMTLEMMNTAIEKLTDHLHPERHPTLKTVKDTLAGAVLIASIIAVIIFAGFIFTLID